MQWWKDGGREPQNAPWAFQKEGSARRVIATLEVLGLVLAHLAFGPKEEVEGTLLLVQIPGFADNKGNGHVVKSSRRQHSSHHDFVSTN